MRMVYIQTMVALDICSESLIYQREGFAGFRPRATRSFCFGKRTQNHRRPGVAPGGCLCHSPDCLGCGTRFAQTVLAPK